MESQIQENEQLIQEIEDVKEGKTESDTSAEIISLERSE